MDRALPLPARTRALFGVREIVAADAKHVLVRRERRVQAGLRERHRRPEAAHGSRALRGIECEQRIERGEPFERAQVLAVDDGWPRG